MKKFDSASIYDRYLDKLSQNSDWKAIVGDSVVSAILKASSEINAETARYAEHLYKESRWDTAQNSGSIISAAGLLGYKPSRKVSAAGDIYISEDPRIHLVGRSIFKDAFLSLNGTSPRITDWKKPTTDISFDKNMTIVDSKGNNFIITSLNHLDSNVTSAFELASGSAYVRNTIIQGVQKEIEIPVDIARTIATRSKLDPYVFIPVEIPSCENASSALTRSFFRVFTKLESSGEELEYRVVDTLQLSSTGDRDVEVYGDLYDRAIIYLKFNSSSSRGQTLSLATGTGVESIIIRYIETLGSAGNISNSFERFTISNIADAEEGKKLYGISLDPIVGGEDEESIYSIKINAPKYYMNSYTVATKEAYENIIKNISFNGETANKVRVYATTTTGSVDEIKQKITEVTMLLPSLEDLATSTEEDPYEEIEKTINYYLSELKSPTDIIKFSPPKYEGFGIGISCTATRADVDNLTELTSNIRQTLEDSYGSRSDQLDFFRNIYSSDIISSLKNGYPALKSISVDLEAVTKLNWNDAQRIKPVDGDNYPIRTIRIPFTFSSLFEGALTSGEGFRDHRTGASYVMRFDIFYHKGSSSSLPPYHTSFFLQEDNNRVKNSFYYVRDTAENIPIWPHSGEEGQPSVVSTGGYPFANEDFSELENGYQFYFKNKYYSDTAFEELIDENASSINSLLSSTLQTPGALDSFILCWGNNEDPEEDDAGDGFFEFDIASFYQTLTVMANQDKDLREILNAFDYSILRCGAADEEVLGNFVKEVLSNYIDIYVSRRLVSDDLIFTDEEKNNNVVFYVDTQDQLGADGYVSEESRSRRKRLLSVECDLV